MSTFRARVGKNRAGFFNRLGASRNAKHVQSVPRDDRIRRNDPSRGLPR